VGKDYDLAPKQALS